MARIEADREDLMKEAVALVRRVEFEPLHSSPPVIAGFRQNGSFSVYFGSNLVYQFDSTCRLRRAYSDGLLYRTQGTTLAQLRRDRTETATTLVRVDLDQASLADFRQAAHSEILGFAEQLASGQLIVARQIPRDDASLIDDIQRFLDGVLESADFLAPAIAGKP